MATSPQSRFQIDEKGQLLFVRVIDKPADPPRPVLNEVAEVATEAHIEAHKDLYDKFVDEQATSDAPQVARQVSTRNAKTTTGPMTAVNKAAQESNDSEQAATERAMKDIKGRKGSTGSKKNVEQQRKEDEAEGRTNREVEMARARAGETYVDHTSQQRVRGIDPNKPAAHSATSEPAVPVHEQNKPGSKRKSATQSKGSKAAKKSSSKRR